MNKEPMEPKDSRSGSEADGASAPRGLWRFGRGAYGSKDVPIRLLDGCIALMILAAVALTLWNASHGGFTVAFEAEGASDSIPVQKVRYGKYAQEPETPVRPGYQLECWSSSSEEKVPWDFELHVVTEDTTLYAVWQPAQISVKFDLDGGSLNGQTSITPLTVTYGQPYGSLPVPAKAGCTFAGWVYSGQVITAETKVQMTGEHVLTALWQ